MPGGAHQKVMDKRNVVRPGKWDDPQVGFQGSNAPALCFYQAYFGRTVLPKWPLWAHLFYSVYFTAFQSSGGHASARRVSHKPCFCQAHCFMQAPLRFLPVPPNPTCAAKSKGCLIKGCLNSAKIAKVGIPKAGIPKVGTPKTGIPKEKIPKAGKTHTTTLPETEIRKPGIPKAGIPKLEGFRKWADSRPP